MPGGLSKVTDFKSVEAGTFFSCASLGEVGFAIGAARAGVSFFGGDLNIG